MGYMINFENNLKILNKIIKQDQETIVFKELFLKKMITILHSSKQSIEKIAKKTFV